VSVLLKFNHDKPKQSSEKRTVRLVFV